MDQNKQQEYMQMAHQSPNMLCSETPMDILEAASSVHEPTPFLEDFFRAGYLKWISEKLGQPVHLSTFKVNNAIIVLWLRASRLHTSLILKRPDDDWDKPLFSDEGLYE